MIVKRPVIIKVILTDKIRKGLEQEYNGSIKKYELELEQLQFQSKKLIQEAFKRGPEAQKLVQDRIQSEVKARKEKIKQYGEILSQLSILPDGSEIEHSRLETEVEVNVGDHWDKLIGKQEIVVKDDIIIDIRNKG